MNCPICGITIESGYISAYNRLCWTPEGEIAKGVTKWAKSENSIVLAEFFLFVQRQLRRIIVHIARRYLLIQTSKKIAYGQVSVCSYFLDLRYLIKRTVYRINITKQIISIIPQISIAPFAYLYSSMTDTLSA